MWCGYLVFLTVLFLGCQVEANPKKTAKPKLLFIMLDGFRYDYVDDLEPSSLPGFTELIKGGVKARWVNPIYPTLSYPSWTTLVTGLYAESHNIVGNYFYDAKDKDVFSLFDDDATGKSKWWTSEPIWTTATKAGLRVALYLWSRCDVPIDDVLPEYCEKFFEIVGPEIFQTNIQNALDRFDEGYDVVQVYNEHLDIVGHTIGPETEDRRKATIEVDDTLVYLQDQLKQRGLEDQINIIIVGDHGMTTVSPGDVTRHNIDDYLPAEADIESIADVGAFFNIKVAPQSLQEVYDSLSTMPGVTVYKKEEIPVDFHFTNSVYIHDIVIISDIDTFVLGSNRSEQLPAVDGSVPQGAHGFGATEENMRTTFYAKGPAFKKNFVLEPINIVDIYQVLTTVLNVEALPHNGTWANVEGAFAAAATTSPPLPLMAGMVIAAIMRAAIV